MKQKKIQIITNLCTNSEGVVYGGGVERWTWEVSKLLTENNFSVSIYQRSDSNFIIKKDNIKIYGIKVKEGFIGNFLFTFKLNKILNIDILTIFISHELMLFSKIKKCIGVNHGIWWNGDFSLWKKTLIILMQKYLIKKSSSIICVDTNYINWCLDGLSNRKQWRQKLHYLPNYADLSIFKFKKRQIKNIEDYVLMYPRRLNFDKIDENPRGIGLLLGSIKLLEEQNIKIKYKFVGRGDKLKIELDKILKNFGIQKNRYEIKDVGIDEIYKEYFNSDIVVIPTLAQEGTSFSAIEAISSGCVTIVTHVGGLGNIVIDGYNGLITGLSEEELSDKIIEGIKHLELINSNCENARLYFSKEIWKEKIITIINKAY